MINRIIGGLVLVLLVSLNGTAFAAGQKMTRDEYKAKLAEYTQRESQAQEEISAQNAQIADLKAQLRALNTDITKLEKNILREVDATEAEVMAFDRQLDLLTKQFEGLMALRPEALIQRRGEVKAIEQQVDQLKMSKISALPAMERKLTRITRMLGEIQARIAQPVLVDYTVARGDNLWSIAEKDDIYADPYMWPRIYRQNRDQIEDPDLIYPKQKLAIPFGVAENQYLVNRGDFLYRIAADIYNDPLKWHKIYEANKQQIVEPHMIFPAQVLDLPGN
jgi:nucleoid-associated protein YgaU